MTREEMDNAVKAWRVAWKGKTCQALAMITQIFPRAEVVVIALPGGPECTWEKEQLYKGGIKNLYPEIKLKDTGDISELEQFFRNGGMPGMHAQTSRITYG